jgi:hypothetical protein
MTTRHTFSKGDRVRVQPGNGGPEQLGTVAYLRMAAPDYCSAEAVCVILDAQRERPGYSGSMFPVAQVTPV